MSTEPASGYDDSEVKKMARRYAKGTPLPPGFLASLDARQSRLFKDALPKRHGKKTRGGA
jgi:hypothetical protein